MFVFLSKITKIKSDGWQWFHEDRHKSARATIILSLVVSAALLASFSIDWSTGEDRLGYPTNIGPEIANALDDSIDWLVVNGEWFFDGVSDNLKIVLKKLSSFLMWVPWPVMISLAFLLDHSYRDRFSYRPVHDWPCESVGTNNGNRGHNVRVGVHRSRFWHADRHLNVPQ